MNPVKHHLKANGMCRNKSGRGVAFYGKFRSPGSDRSKHWLLSSDTLDESRPGRANLLLACNVGTANPYLFSKYSGDAEAVCIHVTTLPIL